MELLKLKIMVEIINGMMKKVMKVIIGQIGMVQETTP